jgi:hypothetical protein
MPTDEQIFGAALQFLARTQLQGQEAPSFIAVVNRLGDLQKLAREGGGNLARLELPDAPQP